MKLERRASFGWPATSAGVAPCRNGLVIHYDGASKPRGVASMDHEKCRQYWKNTRSFHMGPQRGWADIGYAYGVCGHGVVFEGRGFGRQQAAQPGGNSTWTSVTLMLGDGEDPTPAQIEGARELRAWLRGQGLAPAIKGHRDFVSTSCLPLDVTEVLTRRGWVPLGDVTADDLVASWSMDSRMVTFDQPADILEPFEAETLLVDRFESTPDHNWVTYGPKPSAVACSCGYEGSPASLRAHGREGRRRGEAHETRFEERWKLVPADQMKVVDRYLGAVESGGPGLDLSDDEIRLLVWLQGDGHFMREARQEVPTIYGVEWHLRKDRKIERLTGLLERLGVSFRRNCKTDGTTSIRVYGEVARRAVVALLPTKRLHWGLLDLSRSQAEVFLEELIHVDGCERGSYFSSAEEVNLDVVQAVATLNGRIATRGKDPRKVTLRRSGTSSRPAIREVHKIESGRTATVGCLTTVNGTLIIRQHGRTIVIGNCPGSRAYALVKDGTFAKAPAAARTQEDDVAAKDVWDHPIDTGDGKKPWKAGTVLGHLEAEQDRIKAKLDALALDNRNLSDRLDQVLALLKPPAS